MAEKLPQIDDELDDLVSSLLEGDQKGIAQELRRANRIDGDALDIFRTLFAKDPPATRRDFFPRPLRFVRWRNNDLKVGDWLVEGESPALMSASEKEVAAWLGAIDQVNGLHLEALIGLLEGNKALRKRFPKKLAFGGWKPGRPSDPRFREVEARVIVRAVEISRRSKTKKVELAIADIAPQFELKRSTVIAMWKKYKHTLRIKEKD